MSKPIPPHFRDENKWSPMPETEVERLQGTLYNHFTKMKVKMTKPDRVKFVNALLIKQNQTCAFGKNVCGIYCWNEPKENYVDSVYTELTYLKLQWGHIKPRCRKEEQTADDLCLLCARCNNQIQTSRHLQQLKEELISKIEHIDAMISSRKTSFTETTTTNPPCVSTTKKKNTRNMAKCFTNGQRIRHKIVKINKTRIGIYDSSKNEIVCDGVSYSSLSGFAISHHRIYKPERQSAGGPAECKCEVDGKWISTADLSR